ncbi:hypothetical protein F1188_20535 [Roseospira marina]|uniref:DUF4376 domain-containing protein n=1 Tax=Roseospira marina TaxID=140057 RepID=A0A5M6I3F6_9PROT|nr:hypothetical protein [Roseospira marina]KAA5602335.1 hypothetical protein F1188_20535 [Roseospira marina]MBB4316280.1 hypothetical protein [Roseospira marina]MBB5089471.1 hypothetical protein [Roseospira marina]
MPYAYRNQYPMDALPPHARGLPDTALAVLDPPIYHVRSILPEHDPDTHTRIPEPADPPGFDDSGPIPVVTLTYEIRPLTPPEIAARLEGLRAEWRTRATAAFRRARDAGLTMEICATTVHVDTTDTAISQIRALRDLLADTGGTQAFVTRSGARIEADAALMTAIHDAVAARWRVILAREEALYAAIDAAATLQDLRAIDTGSGWS